MIKAYGINTWKEGNLRVDCNANWNSVLGTIGVNSGKWYWEVTVGGLGGVHYAYVGIVSSENTKFWNGSLNPRVSSSGYMLLDSSNGKYYIDNEAESSTYMTGGFASWDIIGVALNLDAGTPTLTYYKNGVFLLVQLIYRLVY